MNYAPSNTTQRALCSQRMVGRATENGGSPVSSRRLSIGLGDSFRSLSIAGVALAALLFLGACTSNGSGESTTTSSIPQSTSSSTDPPSTSTSTSTSTAVTTTLPPTQDVIDDWSAYWDAWAEVRASDDFDPAPLNALAAVDVVEGALTLFERQRTSGLGAVQTEVSLHATVTDSDPDKASIEDCVLLSPALTDTVGVWYQADLSRTDQGWVVAAVRIPSGGGCVPGEMAEAAITGYEAYYEAQVEFWDPPDSDHPLINRVNRPGFRGDSTSMREDGVHGTTAKVSSRVPGEGGAPRLRVA